MSRKVLVGGGVALVLLGPAVALRTVALLMNPAAVQAAACTTSTSGQLSVPSVAESVPLSGTVPDSLTAFNAHGQRVTLNHVQLGRAAVIIAVGHSQNVPVRGQLVALVAALTESSLRVLSNVSAYPTSAGHPHDGDGGDHDSLGLFQMRPSTGWGSVAQLMDPVWSARAFYGGPDGPNHGSPRGLLDVPGWQKLPPGAAAQAVEVSAYPDRYAVNLPVAAKIASALAGVALADEDCDRAGTAAVGGNLPPGPPGFAGRLIVAAGKEIGLPYVWGGGTYTGPSGVGGDGRGPGFDCSGLVLFAAYQATGGRLRLPHYTGDQIHQGRPVAWGDKRPGDLIFYTYPGASTPHHVAIYLGGQRILHAPHTGDNVRYGTLAEFTDDIATVRRLG